VSDSVELDVTPLSDLAISLYLPGTARAMTSHLLALQTSFVASGDVMAAAKLPQTGTLSTWPLLIGVDVTAAPPAASVVAFGSSLTDGDGSTEDANHRWPDVLARRLQQAGGGPAQLGVLNQGIIGNRLLSASPGAKSPFGALLGESGLARFDRDVLAQPGVKYVLLCLGVNDILFPSFPFTPASEVRSADDIIAGYRQLIARAHARRVRIIGTTIPPFEGARFDNAGLKLDLYTPERDRAREAVNEWIRGSGAFDGVIDFDHAVRDPERPARIRPDFAAKDRLHVNDAGNEAQAGSIPLTLFQGN
jgi:lysophospholipase L1-like esterase